MSTNRIVLFAMAFPARGDGPISGMINATLPDLTTLAKNNDGVFPFNAVYETIDGRRMVAAHGTRDMPVWGDVYKHTHPYISSPDKDDRPPSDSDRESFARGRVRALTTYIYELQAD